jgi:Ni/Co efflux regulator RcnB
MRFPISDRTVVTVALAVFLASGAAWAEQREGVGKGNKNGQKHAQKHEGKADKHHEKAAKNDRKGRGEDVRVGGYFNDGHRTLARSYYAQNYGAARGCPPGLAKKNNGCLPPGQAKKYAVGQPLPREVVYHPVPQPMMIQLPAVPRGYRYVRVGNDILLLSPQSALVVDVIVNIFG